MKQKKTRSEWASERGDDIKQNTTRPEWASDREG